MVARRLLLPLTLAAVAGTLLVVAVTGARPANDPLVLGVFALSTVLQAVVAVVQYRQDQANHVVDRRPRAGSGPKP